MYFLPALSVHTSNEFPSAALSTRGRLQRWKGKKRDRITTRTTLCNRCFRDVDAYVVTQKLTTDPTTLDKMNSMFEDTRACVRSDAKKLEESLSRKHQLATEDITNKVCHTIAKVFGDKSVVAQQNQKVDRRLFTPAMPDRHIVPVAEWSAPVLCSRCTSRVQKSRNNKSVSVRRYSIRPEWLTDKQEQKQATDKSPEI
jgi:hypothetical protein